ncbi:PadR family transcriptional regulator [Salipaludibacillus sp. HK11]|uniref:PadR family transcriptional regulator n=1 Tax=Salipaludibacillus sp. HK11 TaxID=3394320 RepID=UPI0039FD5FC2
MSRRTQLLKGILEGCLLAIIHKGPTYGYEISLKLKSLGIDNISEGSIYPLLLRLQKEQYIYGKMEKSPHGPNRKYYYLTEHGEGALTEFKKQWNILQVPINQLLNKEDYK